ncbi:hypothetical protein IWZ00DRAFT_102988 [Phyllosticta capitalensis]
MARSSEKSGNKRKTQSSPMHQAESARNVRQRLSQSSPPPIVRSSTPPLLESISEPFHPEVACLPITRAEMETKIGVILTGDTANPTLLKSMQEIVNHDLHSERIVEFAGIRFQKPLVEAGANEKRKDINRMLQEQVDKKLLWISAEGASDSSKFVNLMGTFVSAAETLHGPLLSRQQRQKFQDLIAAIPPETTFQDEDAAQSAALPNHRPVTTPTAQDVPRPNAQPGRRTNSTTLAPGAAQPNAQPTDAQGDRSDAQPSRESSEEPETNRHRAVSPGSQSYRAPSPRAQTSRRSRDPPVLDKMYFGKISRSVAPTIGFFLDEERLRVVKGDWLLLLITKPLLLYAWYELDSLVAKSGTRNPYAIHAGRHWRDLGVDSQNRWANRFMRIRVNNLTIEHVRNRRHISDEPLKDPQNAPTSWPEPLVKTEPSSPSSPIVISDDEDDSSTDDERRRNSSHDERPQRGRVESNPSKATPPVSSRPQNPTESQDQSRYTYKPATPGPSRPRGSTLSQDQGEDRRAGIPTAPSRFPGVPQLSLGSHSRPKTQRPPQDQRRNTGSTHSTGRPNITGSGQDPRRITNPAARPNTHAPSQDHRHTGPRSTSSNAGHQSQPRPLGHQSNPGAGNCGFTAINSGRNSQNQSKSPRKSNSGGQNWRNQHGQGRPFHSGNQGHRGRGRSKTPNSRR